MAREKICGVYMIQSALKPERVYVGSSVDVNARRNEHLFSLRKNKHHSKTLQRHYNKYGESDLIFEIIESGAYFNTNHLLSREQGWYYHYKYENKNIPYFNTCEIAGSCYGVKHSAEFKAQVSLRKKGVKHSVEHRMKNSEAKKGSKNPNFGKVSPEWVSKMAEINRGSKKSDEVRRRVSEGLLKHWKENPRGPIDPESRHKHGRPQSEERKKQNKEWWDDFFKKGGIIIRDERGRIKKRLIPTESLPL